MAYNTDVLIFVEDPGAANYVAQLPAALSECGLRVRLLADGLAKDHLRKLEIDFEVVEHWAEADRILALVGPRLLIVGTAENPDTLGLALVSQARLAGIESIGVIDMFANADLRFRGRSDSPLAHAPDWLLVPDEWTKDAYVALSYPAGQVVVCGHPHYDYVREIAAQLAGKDQNVLRQRLFPGAPDGRKVVVFATEGSIRLKARSQQYLAECTIPIHGTTAGRTEIVLEEFLDAIQLVNPRPYLVLRLHPKDTPDDYTTYSNEFDLISRGGSSLELIYAADLVVGMTSMLLLEASLIGKYTLSIVPRTVETKLLPTIRLGITPCVTTQKQLRTAIENLLQVKSQVVHADLGKIILPGSLQRTVRFIEGLLIDRRD